jgi:hypothetical protein
VNSDGAITAAAKDTVPPDNPLHLFERFPIDLAPLLIQFTEGINHLIGRHVLGIFAVGHVEKAALRTQTAMDTVGQEAFHFALFPIQDLFNFSRIHGFLLQV